MGQKQVWQSKTVWTNLILAILAFIPDAQAYVVAHPEVFVLAFAGVNVILRLVTKDAIQILD